MKFYVIPVLLAIAIAFAFTWRPDSPKHGRPNILLVVSEDHSPHLSTYGDPVIRTPHLDALAAEGWQFNNAYVTQSVCSPSRSSMLTGLYPHQTGHLGLTTYGYRFSWDVKNIYGMLKSAGYRTGMIGKLHVDPAGSFPIDYHPLKSPNYEKLELANYAKYAETFINASDEPFFLMVNLPDAHWPFQDQVQGRPAQPLKPGQVKPFAYMDFDNERIRRYTTSIYNCLLRLDECIGELMGALKRSQKDRNTLVIYLSDHGDEMARGKFDVYEVGTKIPFIVRWPSQLSRGTRSEQLVSTVDIVPTVLDAAGVKSVTKFAGKSLLPLFRRPEMNFREYLFTEKNADQVDFYFPRRAVRDGRYKLIYSLLADRPNPVAKAYTGNNNRNGALGGCPSLQELEAAPDSVKKIYADWIRSPTFQLYDLVSDPYERRNLAGDARYNGVKDRLFKALQRWQKETDDPLRFPDKLRMLTAEHDTIKVSKNMTWRYPVYLYGAR